jgi:hypothetical protein
MRFIRLSAMLLIPFVVLAQDVRHLLLSSHDKIDGPRGGENHVSDLEIFEDGNVVFTEEGTNMMGAKLERMSYKTTLTADEMRHLKELLGSREIRTLSKKVSSKTSPIDFFWQKSLEINRPDKTQRVQVENFYPFLNSRQPVYPNALIELECSLQDIEARAAKRTPEYWCKELLNRGKTSKSAQVDCRNDGDQPKIVAGEGWGPVRIGAASNTVDAFLGEGRERSKYSEVYFKDYSSKGVQVSFENTSNTVHAIYFYNGQQGDEELGLFCGQTESGINWQSSLEDVKRIYGQPTAEFSGTNSGVTSQRLVFAGIDFRFENGKMVRIGIPGN